MAGRLEGKKTLITAAGQGIGRSTVLAFVNVKVLPGVSYRYQSG